MIMIKQDTQEGQNLNSPPHQKMGVTPPSRRWCGEKIYGGLPD